MRKGKSPVKAARKIVAKAKARSTRRQKQSAKAAKALASRVRRAMPKATRKKSPSRPKAAGKPKARRATKKDVSILSALREGLEFLGESVLPPSPSARRRRR